MNILAVSDVVIDFIYSSLVCERFPNVELVIGCGDLPYYYLEYLVSRLDAPLYYVRGNHSKIMEYGDTGPRTHPHGAIDLHLRGINYHGLLMAGVEGCLRYRPGPFMYSQAGMWSNVLQLVPTVLTNRLFYGRFLDIFVTHAAPWGIHDQPDLPHQGIKAFRWFIRVFQPALHLHGHVHVYRPDTTTETRFGRTQVINTFGFRELIYDVSQPGGVSQP
jgi:hypothetical protein